MVISQERLLANNRDDFETPAGYPYLRMMMPLSNTS